MNMMAKCGWTAAAFAAAITPAQINAEQPGLAMLDQLAPGRWVLRYRDDKSVESVCLRNGRPLLQLRHRRSQCDRKVINDQPSEVTVQYTCRGLGYGYTHIRRESERLVQIEAQGIADGRPFSFTVEGRNMGAC